MFKLSQQDSLFWPVKFAIAVDGGKFENQNFDAQFKRLPKSKLAAHYADMEAGKMTGRQFVEEILVGWRDVQDDGEQVEFSSGARERLLEFPGVEEALVRAYAEAIAGAVRKN